MVLMRGANVSVAAHLAENLRAKIAELVFDEYPELKVTASFGVVSSDDSTDANTLYEHADKALYAAKRGGRDRVEVYTER
jgi:diguanylate cyclase (GGDEF)-like protein